MAIDKARLTKEWIEYLKSNQIAFSSKTEPGKLEYRKKVTSDNLSKFLEVKAGLSPEQISNAIHTVLAKKTIGKGNPKLPNKEPDNPTQPDEPKQLGSNLPSATPAAPKSKYSKDNATDIKFKDITEELRDDTAYTLDETDVEDIFSLLATPSASTPGGSAKSNNPDPDVALAKKEEDIRKLKRIIRDTMTPAQRKSLWRALSDA